MTEPARVVALDGHDGAGKTTIATALAHALGAEYVRPFGGATGHALMAAATAHDHAQVLTIGHDALHDALETHREAPALVLDRSWLTVASLVEPEQFAAAWTLWIPTILCWSDLATTLARLDQRTEAPEELAWHTLYLDRYLELARRFDVPVLRTDTAPVEDCVRSVQEIVAGQR
jgi:hypothetical protein